MYALFDLNAPVFLDTGAFVARFWPSLLVAAVVLSPLRRGVRALRLPLPPPAHALVCVFSLATTALTPHLRGEPRMLGLRLPLVGGHVRARPATNPPHPLARHFETLYTQ